MNNWIDYVMINNYDKAIMNYWIDYVMNNYYITIINYEYIIIIDDSRIDYCIIGNKRNNSYVIIPST